MKKNLSTHPYAVWKRKRSALIRERLASIKLERGCADCGYKGHAAALDFDHVRGEKKFSPSQINTVGWERILEEVGKCEVVCANCHRIRTHSKERFHHVHCQLLQTPDPASPGCL